MESTISVRQLAAWIARFEELAAINRGYLTELDSEIGDGDHGANMARGLAAASERIAATGPERVDELFKTVGMAVISSVGGSAGPLYGTFFLRFGSTAGSVTELDSTALSASLRAGVDGVVQRGKPDAGDKTMFDALAPAVDALDATLAAGADLAAGVAAAAVAARAGRDATEAMIARKGRASYLGERSVGHIDPGAASTALLFEALVAAIA